MEGEKSCCLPGIDPHVKLLLSAESMGWCQGLSLTEL